MGGYLQTGQIVCYDVAGHVISCPGSGQDGELRKGVSSPHPRFQVHGDLVLDSLTGLVWTRNANPGEFPMTWQEALDYIALMNRNRAFNHDDWRLPNRRELRSLVSHQTRKPALPVDYPFKNIFPAWYWSSTSAAISPAHAWYVNMDGARMFYGGKDQSFLVWPVRKKGNGLLPVTGQTLCFGSTGQSINCAGSGQDAETMCGGPWPEPRFKSQNLVVYDELTNLCWRKITDFTDGPVTWGQALTIIIELNSKTKTDVCWRLPNINESESLVDCNQHSPALPEGHPFLKIRDTYWSSTTSVYEPDWAWALYLDKGAIGVGNKTQARFYVWVVQEPGNNDIFTADITFWTVSCKASFAVVREIRVRSGCQVSF